MSLQMFLPTPKFEEYSQFFKEFFTMSRRDDGVLLVQAHTVGGPVQLSVQNHRALGQMLKVVGADPENEILILTGSGDEFMMHSDPEGFAIEKENLDYWAYEYAYKDGRINVSALVNDLEIPTIGLVNGPGFHTEIVTMCDITIAAEDAVLFDLHYDIGSVPADGIHNAFQELLGTKRAAYPLLTGEAIDARKALEYGLVNEVVPNDELIARGFAIADHIMTQPRTIRRLTMQIVRRPWKRPSWRTSTAASASRCSGTSPAGTPCTAVSTSAPPSTTYAKVARTTSTNRRSTAVSDVPVADLVLRNAKVATFTASQPQAQSVAIKDGRVLAVGTDDELTPLAATARHTADLDGRVVLPGLNDSHIHAMRAGLDWERTLHWEDVRSLGEAFARVRAATAERPAGEWIHVVGGWHSRQLRENRLPTRSELDAAAPDHPIYLQELYDRAVLNSAALARCGWDSATADPPGGRLLRDESGALTGDITGIGAFAVPLVLAGRAGCHDFEGLNPDFTISDASYDELLQITRLCARRGWRISVHAVLDSSLARVLDAWEQVERETGRISRLRCSIVHADGASEASLRRVTALRAGVLVQNRLLLKGADYVRAWGQEDADAAPRLGVMRQLGITIGGGTDATRANWYSPWASIWWLVTGRSIDGATSRQESDRLSRYDAIASYTRDAAWFTGEDGFRGRLSPGYDADLCVPTADPFECAEDDLSDLRSELTMVSGRVTHARGGFEELRGRLAADIGYRAVGSG